ncbi:MinD/ParA family ATP-binding protein [Arthrobacter crystallopoietes]|uniref:MinD-like ATPase involved in chromosome partitioning or flagellar assembly n=1 Tax=Crystallibacter crystallopoietes TaxID=37928 RepID=A0A1H0XKY0_9MICC|nr:ParA family protein [Arthrobacter crystallopoietes]SDQ03590.1 MinD-like ATPase involved in chromosome partitioning or flagellar assembly [Arthrobacter crystallopoietes]
MSTNWQGSERKSRAPITLTEPQPVQTATGPAAAIHAVPDAQAKVEPQAQQPVVVDHGEAPLVSGRRSATVLRKENVNDQLPPATGWQAFLRAASFGLISPKVGAAELARRADLSAIQRVYSRPMQVMVAQPLGGVGKTMCSIGLGSTFGIHSGQQTLVWDNNEMMGTAGVRTNANDSISTVWDLLNVLESFETVTARKGELSYYTRHQGNNQFSVLVADEDADRMKSIGAEEFNRIHTVVSRFYDTIIVDTGNNTRSANWLASIEVTDQLVIPTTLKRNAVVSALRMIEQLESMSERTGNPHYKDLVANAVVLVTQGGGAKVSASEQAELRENLASTVRVLIDIPYERALDTGSIIDWQLVGDPARRAFERASAETAAGLLAADLKHATSAQTTNR